MALNLILKIFFQEIQEDTAGSATAEEHEVISKDYLLVTKLFQDSPLLGRPSEHKVELELHSCASSDQVNCSSNFLSEILI